MKLADDIFTNNERIEGNIQLDSSQIDFKYNFTPEELEYIRKDGGDAWLELHVKRMLFESEYFISMLEKAKHELRRLVNMEIKEKHEERKGMTE